jgi:hypothetical protein
MDLLPTAGARFGGRKRPIALRDDLASRVQQVGNSGDDHTFEVQFLNPGIQVFSALSDNLTESPF